MNLRALPFAAYPGPAPDLEPAACLRYWGGPVGVVVPLDKLLPFALVRPYRGEDSRLDCARLVDADTYETVQELRVSQQEPSTPFTLAYEKVTDGSREWILYYGAAIPGLLLEPCRPVRLLLDNAWQSAAMTPREDAEAGLVLEWSHSGVFEDVPYGPGTAGFTQRLYLPGSRVKEGEVQREEEVVTDKRTGLRTTRFATLTRTGTFTVGPLPGWLAQAWQTAALHNSLTLSGFGEVSSLSFKQSDMTSSDSPAAGCRFRLEATALHVQVLTTAAACAAAGPVLRVEPAPEDYEPHAYLCGDTTDTSAHWQRKTPAQTECEQDAEANWERKEPAQTECEQA